MTKCKRCEGLRAQLEAAKVALEVLITSNQPSSHIAALAEIRMTLRNLYSAVPVAWGQLVEEICKRHGVPG